MITLLLVDDDCSIRAGLRMRLSLEADLEVVAEAVDGLEGVQIARQLQPDVILVDLTMPRLDGLTAMEGLRAVAPNSAIVLLTMHDNVVIRERVRRAGAAAFVIKQEGDAALLAAIRGAVKRQETAG
jgi:two-component system response regulator NreC